MSAKGVLCLTLLVASCFLAGLISVSNAADTPTPKSNVTTNATTTTSAPEQRKKTDTEINIEKLENGSLTPLPGDCNPEATKRTLEFLKKPNENVSACTDKYLMNFDLLRKFLTQEDVSFTDHIGSLIFMNAQDRVLKLNCKDDPNDKERYVWKLQELPTGSTEAVDTSHQDEKDFNEDYTNTRRRIVVKSPPDADYYRRYNCTSKSGKKCTHNIHVITRPYARITMEPQYREGQEKVVIKCEMHECLYKYTNDVCKVYPRPMNDEKFGYKVAWRIPASLAVDKKKTDKCIEGLNSENISTFYEPKNPNTYTDYEKMRDRKGLWNGTNTKPKEIKFERITTSITNYKNFKPTTNLNQIVGLNMHIQKMTADYVGDYECIIIDRNGVPSSPTPGSLDSKIRFKGQRKVHVRRLVWTFIPLGILAGMIVMIVACQLACPARMELDDGTIVSTKFDVLPEPAPKPEPLPPPPPEPEPAAPEEEAPSGSLAPPEAGRKTSRRSARASSYKLEGKKKA